MKLINIFNNFLKDTVNLNQTRIDTLESRVETIKGFLLNSGYTPQIIKFSAQGSWAHKTIIRPPSSNDEFDADLVVYIAQVEGWAAKDYILELRKVFLGSGVYSDKISMKSRCVTINYAGDFHLDVVPIIKLNDNSGNYYYYVCNRTDNEFERTDGDGFTDWWHSQDAITSSNNLKKTTRIIKYLRDSKSSFSVKSVLLTTLIGEQITSNDRLVAPNQFTDVPTTLKIVVSRLDSWLQARPLIPDIVNPVLTGESFTRNWTQEQYENFRDKIKKYQECIDDAFLDEDRNESIRKWRRVFGDEFAKGEIIESATSGLARIAESIQHGKDWVALVLSSGRNVLSQMPFNLPHVMALPYQKSRDQIGVRLTAYEKYSKNSVRLRQIFSGDPLEKNSGVEFIATQTTGLPFPDTYQVKWQVVNTDIEAVNANCLRGDYYPSDTHGSRFEATKYHGVHWVQAFVINKRTNQVVGSSERLFVVVK